MKREWSVGAQMIILNRVGDDCQLEVLQVFVMRMATCRQFERKRIKKGNTLLVVAFFSLFRIRTFKLLWYGYFPLLRERNPETAFNLP